MKQLFYTIFTAIFSLSATQSSAIIRNAAPALHGAGMVVQPSSAIVRDFEFLIPLFNATLASVVLCHFIADQARSQTGKFLPLGVATIFATGFTAVSPRAAAKWLPQSFDALSCLSLRDRVIAPLFLFLPVGTLAIVGCAWSCCLK